LSAAAAVRVACFNIQRERASRQWDDSRVQAPLDRLSGSKFRSSDRAWREADRGSIHRRRRRGKTVTSVNSNDPAAERETRELYRRLLEAWDKRNARDFALLFAPDGNIVGFDGTQVFGQAEIGAHLSEIFSHHQTPRYVSIVREILSLTAGATILSAVAGMVPPGKDDINPEVNAVQTMIAVRTSGAWKIALFQNTPAAFHDRPDTAKK
jgi:uncharacterized protein (TIGR02246 family)